MKLTPLIAAALLLAACSKNIQNQEAVRQGIMDYMKSAALGLNVDNMDIDVPAVRFESDHAEAHVTIKLKNTQTAVMEGDYKLDRKGDKWVVNGHGNMSAHSQGGTPDGGAALPPGHPAVSGAPGDATGTQLPPGHPAVGSNK